METFFLAIPSNWFLSSFPLRITFFLFTWFSMTFCLLRM
jgi:hypothetical protein